MAKRKRNRGVSEIAAAPSEDEGCDVEAASGQNFRSRYVRNQLVTIVLGVVAISLSLMTYWLSSTDHVVSRIIPGVTADGFDWEWTATFKLRESDGSYMSKLDSIFSDSATLDPVIESATFRFSGTPYPMTGELCRILERFGREPGVSVSRKRESVFSLGFRNGNSNAVVIFDSGKFTEITLREPGRKELNRIHFRAVAGEAELRQGSGPSSHGTAETASVAKTTSVFSPR